MNDDKQLGQHPQIKTSQNYKYTRTKCIQQYNYSNNAFISILKFIPF